jgi:ABC-type dipeptide/oligopeptide/nickel transport system ATPase component
MHADRIYVLEKGKIIEEGTHDILVKMKGLYYAMWRQQIGERITVPGSGRLRKEHAAESMEQEG